MRLKPLRICAYHRGIGSATSSAAHPSDPTTRRTGADPRDGGHGARPSHAPRSPRRRSRYTASQRSHSVASATRSAVRLPGFFPEGPFFRVQRQLPDRVDNAMLAVTPSRPQWRRAEDDASRSGEWRIATAAGYRSHRCVNNEHAYSVTRIVLSGTPIWPPWRFPRRPGVPRGGSGRRPAATASRNCPWLRRFPSSSPRDRAARFRAC